MPAQLIPLDGPRVETELQAVLADVRALVAENGRLRGARKEALSAIQDAQTAKAQLQFAVSRAVKAEAEAGKATRLGWLEAANFLETCGQFSWAQALRREAGFGL